MSRGIADRLADRYEAQIKRMREQYERSQRYWIEAAETAIQRGDFRPLQLRIDMAKSGPVEITET